MREKIKNYRTRILVWTIILLYIFLAIWIHPEFQLFLSDILGEELPANTHHAQYYIDGLKKVSGESGLYNLSGWVFLIGDEPIDQGMYTRKVVLTLKGNNYFFPINTVERKDVQETFDDLNMDLVNVGFDSWIKIGSLPIGSYKIGFEYTSTQDNSTYYVETNWTIKHTSDELKLKKPNILDRIIFSLKDQWE